MRDLSKLLDEAAGNPPDVPDFAIIRERGDALRSRRRVVIGIASVAAAALVAAGTGVAFQQLGSDPRVLPAGPARSSSAGPSGPVLRSLPVVGTAMSAGTYAVGVHGFKRTGAPVPVIRVPDGFFSLDYWAVYSPRAPSPDTVTPDMHGVQFWGVKAVFDDGCAAGEQSGDKQPWDPGPTVADLAQALGDRDFVSVAPVPVSVAGYDGMYLETVVPDVDFGTCAGGFFESWTSAVGDRRHHQGPGQVDRIWILDVDGYRLVIDAWHMPGSTAEQIETVTRMVDTLTIARPS